MAGMQSFYIDYAYLYTEIKNFFPQLNYTMEAYGFMAWAILMVILDFMCYGCLIMYLMPIYKATKPEPEQKRKIPIYLIDYEKIVGKPLEFKY